MPLYEYECDQCGHRFEQIQKFSDDPIETCPSCGAAAVRKLISPPAIQFKGTGWYITDYAKKEKAQKPGSDKSDAKEKETKDASATTESSKSTEGSTEVKESKTAKKEAGSTS